MSYTEEWRMEVQDFKEYFHKDYDGDDEEVVEVEIGWIENSCGYEFSLKWRFEDDRYIIKGEMENINTSSPFAMMMDNWRPDYDDDSD